MNYVCAIIKDEHEYIREWAQHNRALGFSKIILYDNNSAESYNNALSDVLADGFVEIRSWHTDSPRRQMAAYENFVRSRLWRDNDWCAFIDPDEYIYLDEDKNISEFLRRYPDAAAVTLFWKVYGANGRINKPVNIPMAGAYPKEGCWDNPGYMFKTIARLNKTTGFYDAHRIFPKAAKPVVTTSYRKVNGLNIETDYALAHIKHYMTRSWEDFIRKMKRKNITRQRDVDTFFIINSDMGHLRNELVKDLKGSQGVC